MLTSARLLAVNGPITAAICDMDGTLLHGSVLSPENVRAVQRLKEAGLQVILATGRNHYHITMYQAQLMLDALAVTSDGALVAHPGDPIAETIIHEEHLPSQVASLILDDARERGVSCLCFFRGGVHVTSRTDWNAGMERHSEMGSYFRRDASPASMRGVPIYKTLLFSLSPERLDMLQSDITVAWGHTVDAIRNGPTSLEFVAKGVNKVTGLTHVMAHYGLTPEQTIAIGDGVNDLGMFRWAAYSMCMFHGHPTARSAAKLVVPEGPPATNFADGVDIFLNLVSRS